MLALAVAFWMAGAGCMLGCENMVSAAHQAEGQPPASAAMSADATVVVAPDACASMQGHDCCAKRKSQSHAKTQPVMTSHAGSAKAIDEATHHLAANHASKAALPSTPSDSAVAAALAAPFSMMMDCPLAVNATAALSKARPDDSGGDVLPVHVANSLSYFQEQLTALTPPSLLPNRGHTYLRCCVFLI